MPIFLLLLCAIHTNARSATSVQRSSLIHPTWGTTWMLAKEKIQWPLWRRGGIPQNIAIGQYCWADLTRPRIKEQCCGSSLSLKALFFNFDRFLTVGYMSFHIANTFAWSIHHCFSVYSTNVTVYSTGDIEKHFEKGAPHIALWFFSFFLQNPSKEPSIGSGYLVEQCRCKREDTTGG